MKTKLTHDEFFSLLREHMAGDWWDKIESFARDDPEWDACESCVWHPLTVAQGTVIDSVLRAMREAGCPPPFVVYSRCAGNVFMEWYNDDNKNHFSLDLKYGIAIVNTPDRGIHAVYPDLRSFGAICLDYGQQQKDNHVD